jgi:GNAT superfamily N-acetyltransferase
VSTATSTVTVRPVASKKDLKAFIDLPFRLHAGTTWVPPLKLERKIFLSKKQNPFFTHGEAEYFLAERDGQVVGRITAQIDQAFNDFQNAKWGSFGFIEFEDDPEVFDALLAAAGDWIAERGMERMIGPIDFHMNNEAGLLVEGYDEAPILLQPWHPRYYLAHFERAGLTKAMDLLMWSLNIDDRDKVHPAIFEAAKKAEDEHGLRIEKITRRSLSKDYRGPFRELVNAAWSDNWGFTPYNDADLKGLAEEAQLAITKEWMMKVVDRDGKVVGMAITIPDLNQVLAKMNGKVFPTGIFTFLLGRRKIDRIRVGFLGVFPEYQHTGAAALLYREHFDAAARTPVTHGEMGWILETNKPMNWAMQGMNGKVVKRYRVFDRPLQPGVEPLPAPVPWDA